MRTGRPRSPITRAQVVKLRRDPNRYTWDQIASKLGVHRATAIRIFKKVTK